MGSQSQITSRIETISPATASTLRERFFSKARIDPRLLDSYAADMREGRWVLNGAPIVVSDDGAVLDGRLRLLACIKSGCAFDTLIVEGISPASYETIDAVRKRTLADVLSIRKEQHGRPLAAALRIIWTYLNGGTPGSGKGPSLTCLLSLLEEHPTIRDSVRPALAAMPLLPHGCGIALHYLASQVDTRNADRFVSLLAKPISGDDIRPITQLHNTLADLRAKGGNRKQTYILAVAIKAWNAFNLGSSLKLLRFNPEREAFPKISGLEDFALRNHIPKVEDRKKTGNEGRANNASIYAEVLTITPEQATKMLEGPHRNRHVSASVVHKYARDMKAEQWHLNGQTIKISASGSLLDGQHRLEAARKAKTSFTTIVVYGLLDDSFSSLDIGQRRSVGDILRERGESHTLILASSLRWLWMIRNQLVLAANSSPSNGELIQLLEDCPDIRKSLKSVLQIREIMGSGVASALHFAFSELDVTQADEFFESLIWGTNLDGTSPVYHLRERLIRTRSSHRVRLAEAERIALAIKAWNSFRQDRPMQLLVWRNRGSTREALPTPM